MIKPSELVGSGEPRELHLGEDENQGGTIGKGSHPYPHPVLSSFQSDFPPSLWGRGKVKVNTLFSFLMGRGMRKERRGRS